MTHPPAGGRAAQWRVMFPEFLTTEHWTGSLVVRCASALVLVVLAGAGERLLWPTLGVGSDFLLLTPMLGAIAIYAGAGPALCAMLAGLAWGVLWAQHISEPLPLRLANAAVFLLVGKSVV